MIIDGYKISYVGRVNISIDVLTGLGCWVPHSYTMDPTDGDFWATFPRGWSVANMNWGRR